ncbi:MAG: ABC transporter permease [Bacteroidia bacterium]|nr:ABC transporter permease [Bacteroidia bacterium]
MRIFLSITQSVDAILANKFRAGVTIFIIALGITALVVVMTSIEGIKNGMASSFSSLGANTFRVQNQASQVRIGGARGGRAQKYPPITYREAAAFKDAFDSLAPVSLSLGGTGMGKIKYRGQETNPNVQISGTDENHPITNRYTIADGRALSGEDVELGRNVCVVGHEIQENLSPYEPITGKVINANGQMYKVVGVYEKIGSTGFNNADRAVFLPISTLRNHYPQSGSVSINVYAPDPLFMEGLMEEARGAFRLVRGLNPKDEDDFAVTRSDAFVEQILQQVSILTLAATIIAMITLLGASVALLNVMLVSVTERTNEIGLRKALGATRSNIQSQFLMEAIVICQIGGLFGILLGVLIGNLISSLIFAGAFVVPWGWIIAGIIACLIVGVASGYYPAWKAARVDPIESLRHV